jgi:hypothetical protein
MRELTPKVIRYKYPITEFKGIDALSDASALGLDTAIYACNIGVSDGKLISGPGVGEPDIKVGGVTRRIPDLVPFLGLP